MAIVTGHGTLVPGWQTLVTFSGTLSAFLLYLNGATKSTTLLNLGRYRIGFSTTSPVSAFTTVLEVVDGSLFGGGQWLEPSYFASLGSQSWVVKVFSEYGGIPYDYAYAT